MKCKSFCLFLALQVVLLPSVQAGKSLNLTIETTIDKNNFFDYSISTKLDKDEVILQFDRLSKNFQEEKVIITNTTNIPQEVSGFYYKYEFQDLTSKCTELTSGGVVITDKYNNFMHLKINDEPLEEYIINQSKLSLSLVNSSGFLYAQDTLTFVSNLENYDGEILYCSGKVDYTVGLAL